MPANDDRRMKCPSCGQLIPLDFHGRLGTHAPAIPERRPDGSARAAYCRGSGRLMVPLTARRAVGGSPAFRPGDARGGRR